MPSNHLILFCPLLLLHSIFPNIRVFSNESTPLVRWPKYWSLASVLPMNIQGWFPIGLTGLMSLLTKGLSRVFSGTTVQKCQFFSIQLSLWPNPHICTWPPEKTISFDYPDLCWQTVISVKVKSLSNVRLFATPWTAWLLSPWDFPGKNTGVGCHFLLQGIFLTQGLNPGLPHCRQMLYHLSYQGS